MKVVSARDLAEALDALADADQDTRVLAGGTDLMVEFEAGRTRPRSVVDVWRVAELRGIRDERGGLRLGALTTCTDLVTHGLVRERADILALAAWEVGAAQIRNRATIGGNLGTASPAADINPVLVALDASVRLVSKRGTRDVAVDEFLTGYRTTARAHDELIESIAVPARPPDELRRFRKVGTRRAQSISKLVVAMCARFGAAEGELTAAPRRNTEKDGGAHDDAWHPAHAGHVTGMRAAAGSVAERTVRLVAFERALTGRTLTRDLVREASLASAEHDARPRDDVRSTAAYRRAVLARVLASSLSAAP